MPPFPGTDAEREAVAVYLARLGGTVPHLPAPAGAAGEGRRPVTPLPSLDPLPLPAPTWLLSGLLSLTFLLHVLPTNLLLGGSILALAARVRGKKDERSAELASFIAGALPVLFAAAITLGVAALLFLQVLYGRAFFSAAVILAVPWFLVVPALITGYYAAYVARSPKAKVWLTSLAALVVVPACVVFVAFVQANVMSAMLLPDRLAAYFAARASGLRLNLGDPTLIPRFLHIVTGACAVAGVAVAIVGCRRRAADAERSAWMVRQGAVWFVGATALNVMFGVWWLAALPLQTMLLFMGRDVGATLFLVAGIVAALAAFGHMIPATMAKDPRTLLVGGAGSLGVTLACMVMVRDSARRAELAAAGFQPAAWVQPQWGAILVFLVLLLAAIVLVGWMIRAIVAAKVTV